MKIDLYREPSVGGATLSRMLVDGVFVCDVLEDEVREIPGEPVASWKIKGQTAIPAGTYNITMETSTRFGPNTITINDVPGFVGVRGHAGNFSGDTEGCLLFGERSGVNQLKNSRIALDKVKALVNEALEAGEIVTAEIIPASAYA